MFIPEEFRGLGYSVLPGEKLKDLWGLLASSAESADTASDLAAITFEDPHFGEHYQHYLLPRVTECEQHRKDQLSKLRNTLTFGLFAFILLIPVQILAHLFLQEHDTLLFLAMMLYSGLLVWMWHPIRAYKATIKKDIFPSIFSFFGEHFVYTAEGGLSLEDLISSGILPHYNIAHTEDHLRGLYQNVALEIQELDLKKETGSGKSRRVETVFKGMAIRLSMNKPFHGRTLVKEDQGKLGNWLTDKFSSGGLEKITLEDPLFEREFEVYGSDQIEARYLLTPAFMERLQKLCAIVEGDGLQAAFYDSRLLLLISTPHDRFSVASIFTPATFEAEIVTILSEMKQIFGIIDHLKLYEQTRL
jgi:hypothetical protein